MPGSIPLDVLERASLLRDLLLSLLRLQLRDETGVAALVEAVEGVLRDVAHEITLDLLRCVEEL